MTSILLPARRGTAALVRAGQRFSVVNLYGTQVVDTWAFCAADPTECLSMEHSRVQLRKLFFTPGDTLYSSARRPMLTLLSDTSPGGHDTLCAACDEQRYVLLGCAPGHDNCSANLRAALATQRVERPAGLAPPCPLNLFMNIPVTAQGALTWSPPLCKAGDAVTFRAEVDAIIAFSCCPMDVASNPINGNQPVRDCELRILAD